MPRGPKPKTDEQKKHEGTFRPGRANDTKPTPLGCASKPRWLSKEAIVVWDRLSNHLEKLSMLTPVDADAFALTCEWAVLAERAAAKVNKTASAYLIETPNGHTQASPHLTAFTKASDMYLKFSDRFGLTPTARQSLTGFLRAPSAETSREQDGQQASKKNNAKGSETKARGKLVRFKDRTGRSL